MILVFNAINIYVIKKLMIGKDPTVNESLLLITTLKEEISGFN